MSRSEQREVIIKLLYEILVFDDAEIDYNIDKLIKDSEFDITPFITDSVKGVIKNKDKIIELSNKYLKDWTFDRLNKIDEAILSLGIYEILYTSTPEAVVINEAVRLAKKYTDTDMPGVINGVLDNIYHSEEK